MVYRSGKLSMKRRLPAEKEVLREAVCESVQEVDLVGLIRKTDTFDRSKVNGQVD